MIPKEKAKPDRESEGGREESGRGGFGRPGPKCHRGKNARWVIKKIVRSALPPFQEKDLLREGRKILQIPTPGREQPPG